MSLLDLAMAQGITIAEYQGSGTSNTRPFSVEPGWEVVWSASGDIFQLYLYDSNGDLSDIIANQIGSGDGASYQALGGTYYIQVNAIGDWLIRVVQFSVDTAVAAVAGADQFIEFQGNGALNTRPFAAAGPWEVQWDARGDIFQIFVHGGSGELLDIVANQMGPGTGTSYQPRPGTYYLQVNAIGDWVVRVVSIP